MLAVPEAIPQPCTELLQTPTMLHEGQFGVLG